MGQGGMGWVVANPLFRTPLEHPWLHTMAHITLIGHRDVQSAVGTILCPYHLIGALHCSVVVI